MRTRSRQEPYQVYGLHAYGNYWTRGYDPGQSTVVDQGPGWHQDQYFHVSRISRRGGLMTGTAHDLELNEFPAFRYQHQGPGVDDYDPSVPSDGELAYRVLEKTNPSVPVVDIPAFLVELKDIPHFFKIWGRDRLDKIASLNLKYQFEIKPIVSDLLKIVRLLDDVERRVKMLNKLHTEGKVRKVALVHMSKRELERTVSINSDFGIGISGKEKIEQFVRTWGYTTWYLDNPLSLDGKNLSWLATKLVTGTNLSLSTVWELLPWSWMIDWFANIGSILNASRNSLGCHHGLVYLCENRVTALECKEFTVNPPSVTMSPYYKFQETKERRLATPFLSANLPFLTDRQVSILGSLAVVRGR